MNHSRIVGQGHSELLQWLTETWLSQGPPACFLEGFSGVGKTTIARMLLALAKMPAVMITVPDTEADPTDDILLDLAMELSLAGRDELADAVDSGKSLPLVLIQILQDPLLIVIDELQRTMVGETGKPAASLIHTLNRIANQQRLQGRILLLSNRTIERARWSEPYTIRTLRGLEEEEGEELLDRLLAEAGRQHEVPPDRRRDVVNWLGGNPRAMRVLVASLAHDSLNDLVGLNPEIWEVRDRQVSQDLVRKLERELLQRTLGYLSDEYNLQLRRLSVHRKAFKREAMEFLFQDRESSGRFKNEVIDYFLMEQHLGWFHLHPIVREIGLQRLKESLDESQQAHAVAARHYTRHFRARRIVGWGRLGGYFVEARYHLVNADRTEELRDIALRYESHIKATIKSVSPIPRSAEELNERIAVLTALLETPGPKGLEYHLARLFQARGRTGDLERAIEHARRATGSQSPAPSWVLYGELLSQAGRLDEALALLKEGIRIVPADKNLFSLYQSCGELLSQAGRLDEALALLKEGIRIVPADKSLVSLYQSCGELLSQAGRLDDAVALLKEGIRIVPADKSLVSLYQSCGALLSQAGRLDDALVLLKEGIRRLPAGKFGRWRLQESALLLAAARQSVQELGELIESGGPTGLEPQQRALGQVLLLQVQERWSEAAAMAAERRREHRTSFSLAENEAFSWLCAGHPDRAFEAFERFPRTIEYAKGASHAWLQAFIALRRGDHPEAQRYLSLYLDRELEPGTRLDEAFLLALWDRPSVPGGEPDLAYYHPTLPPSLTGLDAPVTRIQYQPSVLPERIKRTAPSTDHPVPPSPGGVPPVTDTEGEADSDAALFYQVEGQPWYAPQLPQTREIGFDDLGNLKEQVDVVIMAATETEIKAVLRLVAPLPRRACIYLTYQGPETYYLGRFGAYNTIVTKCRMGSIGEGAVILAANQAQQLWRPRAVIMTGIAFGRNPAKQKMADVLIASQVISYEQQRVGQGEIIQRGSIPPSDTTLLNRFENVQNWEFRRPDGKLCALHIGPVLSGEKLVDSPEFKAALFERFPQAIGGEMEGAGLVAASGRLNTPWILAKAICDWGDGQKHSKHQPLAAAAAASLVHHILSQRTVLDGLKKPDG